MSATRADPPADDPTAPLTRAAGRQLARLWSSRPGELPAPAPLEPRDLARLRDILGALAAELEHPDAGSARRIDAAWAALGGAAIRAPRTVAGEDVPLPPLPPPAHPVPAPAPALAPAPAPAPAPALAPARPSPWVASVAPVAPTAPPPVQLETEALDPALLARVRAAMPFQGSRPAPPPSTPVEPPSRKPAPRSELDETSAFHGLPDLGTVLPFGPSAPPSRPPEPAPVSRPAPRELTFEEYASFCAARAQAPGHAAALAVRFGVGTSEACAALDAVWRARAERDRALSSALAARIAEYRAWLEAERARGRLP